MSPVSTEAIVLRTVNYSETSVIATVFSKTHGKIALMAKGARKPKSPFFAQFEPMNSLQIDFFFKENRNIQTLKNSNFSSKSETIRQNFDTLNYGIAIVDILDKVLHDTHEEPIIFKLTSRVLEFLGKRNTDNTPLFHFFLIQFSIYIGFMPSLKSCNICDVKLSDATFDEHSGELICKSCSSNQGIHISSKTIELLQLLVNTNIENLNDINYHPKKLAETGLFLQQYLRFHLENIKFVKSLKLLDEFNHG